MSGHGRVSGVSPDVGSPIWLDPVYRGTTRSVERQL